MVYRSPCYLHTKELTSSCYKRAYMQVGGRPIYCRWVVLYSLVKKVCVHLCGFIDSKIIREGTSNNMHQLIGLVIHRSKQAASSRSMPVSCVTLLILGEQNHNDNSMVWARVWAFCSFLNISIPHNPWAILISWHFAYDRCHTRGVK